jgi:ATP-dependent Clp protease protease subunit
MFQEFQIDGRITMPPETVPKIITVRDFDEEGVETFAKDMVEANDKGQDIIPIIIDSYGGSAYALLRMIDIIENIGKPVATIIEGKAMSCGSILAAMGTPGYRFAAPRSWILLHATKAGTMGTPTKMVADVAHVSALEKDIYTMMAKHCKQNKNYFLKLIREADGADIYFTPKEAVKHKVCDIVAIPRLITTCEVKTTFGY